MIASKPKSINPKPDRPARKPCKMTVAIGMLSTHGAVIAADTRLSRLDGSTYSARKLCVNKSPNGVFAIAFAADDASAAQTLVDDLMNDLVESNPISLQQVEELARPQMTRWAATYLHSTPNIELILGASILDSETSGKNRGRIGLYFCQPPNTMNRVQFHGSNPETYIGIGQGASITDPLYRGLFDSIAGPKTCLQRIAYLMYRAKKDYANGCGGDTTAVFLRESPPGAFEIAPVWMQGAEITSASVDKGLSLASSAILSPTLENAEAICDLFRAQVRNMSGFRSRTSIFTTLDYDEICDDGIVRPLPKTS
jgi:hypothetical protein